MEIVYQKNTESTYITALETGETFLIEDTEDGSNTLYMRLSDDIDGNSMFMDCKLTAIIANGSFSLSKTDLYDVVYALCLSNMTLTAFSTETLVKPVKTKLTILT